MSDLTVIFAHSVGHGIVGPFLGGLTHEVDGESGPGIEILDRK